MLAAGATENRERIRCAVVRGRIGGPSPTPVIS